MALGFSPEEMEVDRHMVSLKKVEERVRSLSPEASTEPSLWGLSHITAKHPLMVRQVHHERLAHRAYPESACLEPS
jgi:hypothetical protein